MEQENNKEKNSGITEEELWAQAEEAGRINVYKWIKILQAIILIVLGILFVVMAIFSGNGGDISLMLSISAGIVAVVYGVMNILSGYLLYRQPFNHDVLIGELAVTTGIVFFIKHEILNEILSYFVIVYFFVFAVMLILFGVDCCVNRKTIKHGVTKGVFAFIGAALLAAGAGVYTYFYLNKRTEVERYMLMIVGGLLVLAGLFALINTLVKAHNTKVVMKQKQIEREKQAKASAASEKENKEVKVIDISDLRKNSAEIPESDKIVVEEDDKDDEDTKKEEEKQDTTAEEPKAEEAPVSTATAVTIVDASDDKKSKRKKR